MAWVESYLEQKLGNPKSADDDWVRYNCPFCAKRGKTIDHKRHLYVAVEQFRVYCFRCHYSATLIRFVRELEGRALTPEVMAELRDLAKVLQIGASTFVKSVRTVFQETFCKRVEAVPRDFIEINLPKEYKPFTPDMKGIHAGRLRSYALSRGIPEAELYRRRIGYAMEGRYSDMLIFPITYNGATVYFTTRKVGALNGGPKNLNPEKEEVAWGKGVWVYGWDEVSAKDEIVVVEGPIDALVTQDATAIMGTHITPEQVFLLSLTQATKFTVCLDGEADVEAQQVASELRSIGSVEVLALPHKLDPADVGGKIREHAVVIKNPFDRFKHHMRSLGFIKQEK